MSPSPLRDSGIIASCMNLLNIMTPCRNLCEKIAYPCFASPGPYALGLRYCTKCEKYFQMDAIRCPCCNRRLRYRKKKQHMIICDICDQEAFIFQNEGSFCLNCWQDRTEPHITWEGMINKISIRITILNLLIKSESPLCKCNCH